MLPTAGVGVEPQLRAAAPPRGALPEPARVQPLARGGLGLRRGRPHLRRADPLARRSRRRRSPSSTASLARGARFVVVTCGPIDGRSPGDPHFDPFWARVQESGIDRRLPHRPHALQRDVQRAVGPAPAPAVAPPLADGVLPLVHRAPDHRHADGARRRQRVRPLPARCASGASSTAPPGTRRSRTSSTTSRASSARTSGASAPRREAERPAPQAPLDLALLRGRRRRRSSTPSAPSTSLAGSDYPHPEGLATPAEFAEEITTLSPTVAAATSSATTS